MIQTDFQPHLYPDGCVVAMGTFDGVHLGHRAVIEQARQYTLPIVVVTTFDHPHRVPRILSHALCEQRFETLGVDRIVYFSFSDIQGLSPEQYLDLLCREMNAKAFCCGYNFRFGKNAVGNVDTVKNYVNKKSLRCSIADKVDHVSSTAIRELLCSGEIERANTMLSEPYGFCCEVIHGDERGRTWHFPTINQKMNPDHCLPKFGVYVSQCYVNNKWHRSVTNIGIRPTFQVEQPLSETYIIDFDGDLYGQTVPVQLLHYLRPEQKFSSPNEVKQQIERDKRQAAQF